jgi:hypothetical protein
MWGKGICRVIFIAAFVSALASVALSQTRLPDEDPPKEKAPAPAARKAPKGAKTAATRSNGVLFVLTEPPAANVNIKNRQGESVRRGQSDSEGEFRAELSPGTYDVEVTIDMYLPLTRKAVVPKANYEVVRAELTPTTGSITILGSFESDMQVFLDGKPAAAVSKTKTRIELKDVLAGAHTLRMEHPAMEAWEQKVEVKGGATTTLSAIPKRKMASLVVTSERDAMIFLDDKPKARVGESGQVAITDLEPGKHTVRAEKELHEKSERTIELVAGKEEKLEMRLAMVALSPAISDSFREGIKFWDAPVTWQASNTAGNLGMIVSGPGVGFARDIVNDRHHVYKDFTMTFAISFRNGKGAAWVMRARDKNSYYLFQLVGPKGTSPNTFRSFICQNGEHKQLRAAERVPEDLGRPDDTYQITIEARGGTITHRIQANSAPKSEEPKPFSVLQNVIFSQGGIGFGTKEGEEFIVRFLGIIPND